METPKLTVTEKSRVINERTLDYTPDPRGLGFEFYFAMMSNRNVVAQIDAETGESDTYGHLLQKCSRVCVNLLLKGITKDDVICQCSSNNLNSCVPIICAFFLGVRVTPLDPSLPLDELIYLLNQVEPRIIFVSTEVVELVHQALEEVGIACEIVIFGESEGYTKFKDLVEPLEREYDFKPLPITDIRETAIILFSSGKTEPPKGICLSHYSLMVQLVNTVYCCNLGKIFYLSNYVKERSRGGFLVAMHFMTYHWLWALQILNCSTITGITRVICRNFEAATAWTFIDKYNVSFMTCFTYEAIQLSKNGKPEGTQGKSLRMLLTTGTRFSKSSLLELRKLLPKCFITNAYDAMQASGAVAMFSFTKPEDIIDQYENPTSCGKLVPGITCKIVDPITGKILGAKQAGELYYIATFATNGYHRVDSFTAFDKSDWIRTGDVAFYDEKRCIYVLDPYEDVFRYKSHHLVPSLIENVIKEHPAVEDAIVVGIPHKDENIGEVAMAVVSLKTGMTADDIKDFATNQKLSRELKIIQRKQILLTPTGVPKRQQLRKLILGGVL